MTLALSVRPAAGAPPTPSISQVQALSFGSFAPQAAAGTVTVSPAGVRSGSNVALLSADAGYAAQFLITGRKNASYTVSLPANGSATLRASGKPAMTLDFVSSPANTPSAGLLDKNGMQTLNIGATLHVGANQPAGTYSGTFNVTVDYP